MGAPRGEMRRITKGLFFAPGEGIHHFALAAALAADIAAAVVSQGFASCSSEPSDRGFARAGDAGACERL